MNSKCFEARVLTLFPEMFPGPLAYSLAGKAIKKKIWKLNTINIRDYAEDKHGTVDDEPYGGGPGMIMRPDILGKAFDKNYPDGTYKKNLDSSKINYFGWYPNIDFKEGLKKVILNRKK